ncbi:hypothetical protein AKJ18_20670 [Vibrio xuii]|nr:hypothetical protein AKJ18_20670 [Vibrio xuii]
MKVLRLIFKCLFVLIGAGLLLVGALAFWGLSGLIGQDLNQGGDAIYDYAPDGQYKAMRVYFQDEAEAYQLVLDANEGVIYVAKFGNIDQSLGITVWANADDEHAATYNYVRMSYQNFIFLPVPFYERWYAWLFMNVRNVDLDKLKMIPD